MLSDHVYRLRALFRRNAVEAELDEELRYHLEREAAKYQQAGATAAESTRRARMALGGPEQVQQQCREARGTRLLEDLAQDVRYGIRTLAKSPGFSIVTILTLALGIAACTAVFSIVNAVLLRSLPYGDPARLVYLLTPNPNFKDVPIEAFGPSYADYFDLRRQSHSFSAMTIFEQASYSVASRQSAERVGAGRVDGDFFSTLQASPEIGRSISAGDNLPGHDAVVVISHSLWQSMFAGSADILTRSLRLDGRAYRIIGVMPSGFGYPHDFDLVAGNSAVHTTQLWVPLALSPQQRATRDDFTGNAVARLKPGVSVPQAQAEMATIMTRLNLLHQPDVRGWGAFLKPLNASTVGTVRPLMWTLLGAVSFVLLISCGNAANLLLARSASRTHELGVRAALGAGRGRVIRQILTESLLLGLAGGFVGILLAYGFVRGLLLLNPGDIPRLGEATVGAPVLLFTVVVALLTSALFGILPALSVSHIDLVGFLKAGSSRGTIGGRRRVQGRLIVGEVALVVVLLAGAGLLLHSYANLQRIPTGFSSSTISMGVQLDSQYAHPEQRLAFFQRLLDKFQAIPGVQSVGMISNLPLGNSENLSSFFVEGYANQQQQLVPWRVASPQYFSAMSIPLLAGRSFTDGDSAGQPLVIVINQAFAKQYFRDRDPLGRRVKTSGPNNPWRTVVGVVANVRDASLEAAAVPEVFQPLWQSDASAGAVVMRSSLPSKDLAGTVRSAFAAVDPNLALTDIHTMGELVSEASARRRFQTTVLTVFAAMALLLALVGFYGLLAYSVKQRTAEIGLRIALGASRTRVLVAVLREGFQLVLTGLLIGLAGALVLNRLLASWLYGVRTFDPVTLLAVPALLLAVTLAASLMPGWKAASVEPVRRSATNNSPARPSAKMRSSPVIPSVERHIVSRANPKT